MPKVSICVPNLNTRPFLPARFETIFNQTLEDWELIVCDGHSDDGAWEYLQELAAREPRMRIFQSPRRGVYAGFNECISQARGEYVYIATSDDTMSPDCLEKLVAALEQNPDCGLAHCGLDFIDEDGAKITSGHCWANWPAVRFFGDWNQKPHVRPQGHDAVVALALKSVYYSVTQILIRSRLFDRVGLFETRWGSFGDLEWQMRAAVATKTVHVPEHLATWRIHPRQASQLELYYQAIRDGWVLEMADNLIRFSKKRNLPFRGGLPKRLGRFFWNESLAVRLSYKKSFFTKLGVVLGSLGSHPGFFLPFLKDQYCSRVLGKKTDLDGELRSELRRLGLDRLTPANSASRSGGSKEAALAGGPSRKLAER